MAALLCHAQELASAQSILQEITSALKPGDSSEAIEAYFKNRGLPATYDKYQHRYQSIVRNTGRPMGHAVVIYVYTDDAKRLSRVQTQDSYTAP
jgi:hypothetical protein